MDVAQYDQTLGFFFTPINKHIPMKLYNSHISTGVQVGPPATITSWQNLFGVSIGLSHQPSQDCLGPHVIEVCYAHQNVFGIVVEAGGGVGKRGRVEIARVHVPFGIHKFLIHSPTIFRGSNMFHLVDSDYAGG